MAEVAGGEGHRCIKPTPFTSMDHSYWRSKLPPGFSFYIDRLARGMIRVMPSNGPEFSAVLMEELLFRRNAELANLPRVSLLKKLKEKVEKRGFGGPVEPIDADYGVGCIPGGKCVGCGGCKCQRDEGGCSHLSRCACNKYLLGPSRPPAEIKEDQVSSKASSIACAMCAGKGQTGGRGDSCICDTGFPEPQVIPAAAQVIPPAAQVIPPAAAEDCSCGQPPLGSSTPWPTPCPCGAGELPPPTVTFREESRARYDTCVQCNFGTDVGIQCCKPSPGPSPFSPFSPTTCREPSSYTSSMAPPPPPQPTCECSSTATLIRPQPVRQICVAPAESPVCLILPESQSRNSPQPGQQQEICAAETGQAEKGHRVLFSCSDKSQQATKQTICSDKSITTDPSVEISRPTQTQPFFPPMPYFPMSMMPGQCCMQRGMQMPPIPPWCLTPVPGPLQSCQYQTPYMPDSRSPICGQSPYEQYGPYVPPNLNTPPAPKPAAASPKACSTCAPDYCQCKRDVKSRENAEFERNLRQQIEIKCISPGTMSPRDPSSRSPSSERCSSCKPYHINASGHQSPKNLPKNTSGPGRPSPHLYSGTSTLEPGKRHDGSVSPTPRSGTLTPQPQPQPGSGKGCGCRARQGSSRSPTPELPRSGTVSPRPPTDSGKRCGCQKRRDGSRSPQPEQPRSGTVSPQPPSGPGKGCSSCRAPQDGSRSPSPEPRSSHVCKCRKRGHEKEKTSRDQSWKRDVQDEEVEKFCNACISSAMLSVGGPSMTDCRDSGEPRQQAIIEVSYKFGESDTPHKIGDGYAGGNLVKVKPVSQGSCMQKCSCGDTGYKNSQDFRGLCDQCSQDVYGGSGLSSPRKPRSARNRSDVCTRTDMYGNRLLVTPDDTECPLQRAECACRGKPYDPPASPYSPVSDLPGNQVSCQSPSPKQQTVASVEDRPEPINVNVCVQVESVFDSNDFLTEVKKHISSVIDEVKVSQIQALSQMQSIEAQRTPEYPPFLACKCAEMTLPSPPPPSRDLSHSTCGCGSPHLPEIRWQKDASTSVSVSVVESATMPQDDVQSLPCDCGSPHCFHSQMAPPPPPPPPAEPEGCACGSPTCLQGQVTQEQQEEVKPVSLYYCDCGNPICLHGPNAPPMTEVMQSDTASATTGRGTYSESCSPAPFMDASLVQVNSLFPRRPSEEEINMAGFIFSNSSSMLVDY